MSAPPIDKKRKSNTRSNTSLPALATQPPNGKTKTVTLTTSKSKSGSRSLKRSKSPRSKRSARKTGVESVDTGETHKRITSRRYVYNVEDHQGEPQIYEKLDISGQSLTVINSTVFNNVSINELDASTNNVRTVPVEIRNMQLLVYLDLSRNPIQCQHPNDSSGLPLELGQLPNLRVIVLVECNLLSVPPVVWNCVKLRALDISRNRIARLPAEVGRLTGLRYLSVQQAGLQTLPAEIACCRKLTDLLLWGNSIRSLPPSVKYLTDLRRLELTCRNFTVDIDSYMDSLLQSGQIQSEHIPNVLFELPRLEELDLENTKVNVLPEQARANHLRKLHLAGNFLKSMPQVILNLNQLTYLDMSNNYITGIPDEICKLSQLETLMLKHNQISHCSASIQYLQQLKELYLSGNRIKQLPIEIGQLKELRTFFLDDNLLTTIPETFSELTQLETLVLSDNRLERIPVDMHKMTSLTAAHAYKKLDKYGLWIHPNPSLRDPPGTVWRTGTTARLFRHLAEQKVHSLATTIHRQKVVVIGESGAGKTSLIETLVTCNILTTCRQTELIQHRHWTTPNRIHLDLLEIFGCDTTSSLYPLFFDQSALFIVVFDASTYSDDAFCKHIGRWLDVLSVNVPDAVVHVVGTHTDKCREDSLPINEATIWQLTVDHINTRQAELAESKLRHMNSQTTGNCHQEAISASAADSAGIRLTGTLSLTGTSISEYHTLISKLELIVVDGTLFAGRVPRDRMTPVLIEFGKTLRNRQKGLFVGWDEALSVGEQLGMLADHVENAIKCLAAVGEMLWWPDVPAVNRYIFTRPSLVISILQRCFRRPDDPHFDCRELFNAVGQFNERLPEVIQRFASDGRASRKFLLSLLFDLGLKNGDYVGVIQMLRDLDLLYVTDDDEIVLPAMMQPTDDGKSCARDIAGYWPAAKPRDSDEAAVSVMFFVIYPQELFDRLACRLRLITGRRLFHQHDLFIDDVDDDVRLMSTIRHIESPENAVAELVVKVRSRNVKAARKVRDMAAHHVISALAIYRDLVFVVNYT